MPMKVADDQRAPDAQLLLTQQCPHCPTVLRALSELVKQGLIGRLEVVNLDNHPEVAEALAVKSVPWVRIGPFHLQGVRSQAELALWAERAGTTRGMADYFADLMLSGGLDKVTQLIRQEPSDTEALLLLLGDPGTELSVRIGIGAIMETMSGTEAIQSIVEPLGSLTQHRDARVRHDACHFLSLTLDPRAIPYIRALLKDADEEVREVARESLQELKENGVVVH